MNNNVLAFVFAMFVVCITLLFAQVCLGPDATAQSQKKISFLEENAHQGIVLAVYPRSDHFLLVVRAKNTGHRVSACCDLGKVFDYPVVGDTIQMSHPSGRGDATYRMSHVVRHGNGPSKE